jgi:hypothetical protein
MAIVAVKLDRMEAEIIANGTATENPYDVFEKERKEKEKKERIAAKDAYASKVQNVQAARKLNGTGATDNVLA